MKKTIKTQEENKKREAFKRFSKMSAAGLAVISLSAFTNLPAQEVPTDTLPFQKKNPPFEILRGDGLSDEDTIQPRYMADNYNYPEMYINYANYCNYTNSYSNNYGNGYTNNYSNAYSNNYSNNYSNAVPK